MAFWAPTPRFCEEEVFGSYWHFLRETETEKIKKPYLRETARNYEKRDLQNVLEQVFFIPMCL